MKENKFKRWVPFALTFFLFAAGCGGKTLRSSRSNSPILIDGRWSDWSDYSQTVVEEEGKTLLVAAVNSDSTLDLMFRLNDVRLAALFERRGVTLWLDPERKKRKELGIRYRREGFGPERGDGLAYRSPEVHGQFKPGGRFVVVRPGEAGEYPLAAAATENGSYCYEFRIPLGKDDLGKLRLFMPPDGELQIGVEVAPLSDAEREQIKERMKDRPIGVRGGGSRPGGRMGRRGGMRGGMMPNQRPDRMEMEIWFKLQLAGRK